jgi:heme-degrading monooxygenase HmoA
VPNLERLSGFEGCYLLEAEQRAGETQFVAITLWESTEAIAAFAGEDITRSHVEPEGQDALSAFDPTAINYAVTVRGGTVGASS